MYEQPKSSLKKIVVLSIIFLVFIFAFFLLWNTTYVQISVTNPVGGGNYIYQIVDQKSGKAVEVKSQATSIKKRLTKGDYSVLVKQAATSYFTIIKTNGFLKTSSLSARLSQEKSRRFVGDNPNSCMAYIVNVLVSYSCTDLFENINIHQPASASTPTYVIKNPDTSGTNGYVQGIAQTSHETVALIKTPADSDIDGGYSLLDLGANLIVASQRALTNLNLATNYSLIAYKDGFLIYDQDLSRAYYYSSLASNPVSINLASPNNSALTASYLAVKDNLILTAYVTGTDTKNAQTEIIINDSGKNSHYNFGSAFSSAVPCDNQTLCGVDSSGLVVYDLTAKKPKQLYNLLGVSTVLNSSKGILVLTKDGVLNLVPAQHSGFLEYSFGDYKFNNIQSGNNSYVLNLTNPIGKKVALLINQTPDDTDQIDKKVLDLQKSNEISDSSVYGQYIFISPNLGPLIYNNSLQSYDYDPTIKAGVNSQINQAIDKAGINRSTYQIINTAN